MAIGSEAATEGSTGPAPSPHPRSRGNERGPDAAHGRFGDVGLPSARISDRLGEREAVGARARPAKPPIDGQPRHADLLRGLWDGKKSLSTEYQRQAIPLQGSSCCLTNDTAPQMNCDGRPERLSSIPTGPTAGLGPRPGAPANGRDPFRRAVPDEMADRPWGDRRSACGRSTSATVVTDGRRPGLYRAAGGGRATAVLGSRRSPTRPRSTSSSNW